MKLARGSVIDVDARGRARMLARERYDREQMDALMLLGGDDDKARRRRERDARRERNKRRARELAAPLLDGVDAVVDVIDDLGELLFEIPAPVLIGGALYVLGPSVVGGAIGAVARDRIDSYHARARARGRRGR